MVTLSINTFLLLICACSASLYRATVERVNKNRPFCCMGKFESIFDLNYNPSLYQKFDSEGKVEKECLFVRSQNITKPDYGVGPSVITLACSNQTFFNDLDEIKLNNITKDNIILEPESQAENYGVEDPRVVYRPKDKTYYMYYTAAEVNSKEIIPRLALATSKTPSVKSSWVRHGPIIKEFKYSKSGSLILRDEEGGPHFLIWGEHTVYFATTEDLLTYKTQPKPFIEPRPKFFDSYLVEAGPHPVKLSDGNYFFIYNSARHGYPSPRPGWDQQYNAGFLILDKDDPSKILYRSSEPIFSPELLWEIGYPPFGGLVPNVAFVEGIKPLGNDRFLLFYGGADTVLGAAVVKVEIS